MPSKPDDVRFVTVVFPEAEVSRRGKGMLE